MLKQNQSVEQILIIDVLDLQHVSAGKLAVNHSEDYMWRFVVTLIMYDSDTDQIIPFGHCLI